MAYYSGQGKLFAAERNTAGVPKGFRYMGNVPALSVALSVTTVSHKESTDGQRLVDQIIHSARDMKVSFTLEEFNPENVARVLYGTAAAENGAAIVDESMVATGMVAGDYIRTKHPKISAVTVKDSAGSPATLSLTTDYVIDSADHGLIKIVNVGAYVQPFKVSYTYATYDNLTMFTQAFKEHWLRFDGLNTANSNKAVVIELYRVILDPLKDWALLSDDFAKWQCDGSAMFDSTTALDAELGGYGRVEFVA